MVSVSNVISSNFKIERLYHVDFVDTLFMLLVLQLDRQIEHEREKIPNSREPMLLY